MGVWDLFTSGRSGRLALGMSPGDVRFAFREPDDWAVDRRDRPTIFKYDGVELHFFNEALAFVHAELSASEPGAFHSQRLGLAAAELTWPIDLEQLAAAAKARGLTAVPDTDVLGRPQLTIGNAVVTHAGDTVTVSVRHPPSVA